MRFIIFLLLVIVNFGYALSFTELRYSDAFERTKELKGDISFSQYGVKIRYKDTNKSIDYDDGDLKIYDGNSEILLNEFQEQKMGAFLDILILVHSNDKRLMEENFEISYKSGVEILIPKGEMREYLKKIELKRYKKEFSFIKLFFNNNDTITIEIDNETN